MAEEAGHATASGGGGLDRRADGGKYLGPLPAALRIGRCLGAVREQLGSLCRSGLGKGSRPGLGGEEFLRHPHLGQCDAGFNIFLPQHHSEGGLESDKRRAGRRRPVQKVGETRRHSGEALHVACGMGGFAGRTHPEQPWPVAERGKAGDHVQLHLCVEQRGEPVLHHDDRALGEGA